eukprot:GEMP01032957.1.p1 GENE.GEMP01032957.1~~GEMP01032957.1.p1  ORF type:complete len:451 (+),score=105.00 GEMP01032957.1:235-1587(+)
MSHELEGGDAVEFYRNRAEAYHAATDKVQLELTTAASSLLKTPPQLLLDLGCGSGLSTSILALRWPRTFIIAADISAEMLHVGKRSGCLVKPRMDTVKLDFSKPLPFRASIVDTAVSISAIQWLFVKNDSGTSESPCAQERTEARETPESPCAQKGAKKLQEPQESCVQVVTNEARRTPESPCVQERTKARQTQESLCVPEGTKTRETQGAVAEPSTTADTDSGDRLRTPASPEGQQTPRNLSRLLHELRRILTPMGEMSLQFYPLKGNPKSVENLRVLAETIFGAFPRTAVVLDHPHGNAHRKFFLRLVPTGEVRPRPWCALCWPICDAVCRYQIMRSGLEKAHEEMAVKLFRNIRFLKSTRPTEDGGTTSDTLRRPKKKRKCVDDVLDVPWKMDSAQALLDEFQKHPFDAAASVRDQLVSALGSDGMMRALHSCKEEWLNAPSDFAHD